MSEFLNYIQDFNTASVILRICLAVFCGSLIGIERGKHGRAAGLRTHILVCLGAAITSLTSVFVFKNLEITGDVFRISAQVISGIGFLGAGTILVRNKSMITGLTTAAGVWATGSVGIAIGYGFYLCAILCTFIIFFVTGFLGNFDRKIVRDSNEVTIYIEFINAKDLNETLNKIRKKGYNILSLGLTQAKTNNANGIGANITLSSTLSKTINPEKVVNEIDNLENVNFAINII